MNKKVFFITTAVVVALILSIFATLVALGTRFSYPIPQTAETLTAQLEAGGVSDPDALLATGNDFSTDSPYGYVLDATLLPVAADQPQTNYIILNHDFGESKQASLQYYQLFHDLGFNVIVYSQRGHGASGNAATTYGEREKYDLQALVDKVLSTTPDAVIGVHGVGLGAATVLEYAHIAGLEVDFYIAQGAFPDVATLIDFQIAQRAPRFAALPIEPALNVWLQLSQQLTLADLSPLQAAQEIPNPVLFIYGTNDPYAAFSEAFVTGIPDTFADMYLVEAADAQTVYSQDPATYKQVVSDFIKSAFNAE